MSQKILISCDSTTDLGPELIKRYGVEVLPLTVTLGDKQYADGVDLTATEIFDYYEQTKLLPKTSAVNMAEYSDFFEKFVNQGYSIVFFSLSSDMSSTCQNAVNAAKEFEDVYVVDTRNLSTGGGLLVIKGAELKEAGFSAKEIAEKCSEIAERVDASFVIDNMEFLQKGGRCSALAAFGANLLKIKPSIMVKNGKMEVGKKYRGKFDAVLKQYISDKLAEEGEIELDHIFVTHTNVDEEIVKSCKEQVGAYADFKEIHTTTAGCTIASHCGKNTLGILFVRK